MIEMVVTQRLQELLAEGGVSQDTIDELASSLLWRVGRGSDEEPVTVRVGFATSAGAFAELPRLRNATDEELREAVERGELKVEWVGARSRVGS
jgi:hypothetical protein